MWTKLGPRNDPHGLVQVDQGDGTTVADAGYYIDLGGQIIRLGPAGVYPYKPHDTGYVAYRFAGDVGQHGLRLEYQDDADGPADTEGAITLLLGHEVVGVVEADALAAGLEPCIGVGHGQRVCEPTESVSPTGYLDPSASQEAAG